MLFLCFIVCSGTFTNTWITFWDEMDLSKPKCIQGRFHQNSILCSLTDILTPSYSVSLALSTSQTCFFHRFILYSCCVKYYTCIINTAHISNIIFNTNYFSKRCASKQVNNATTELCCLNVAWCNVVYSITICYCCLGKEEVEVIPKLLKRTADVSWVQIFCIVFCICHIFENFLKHFG